MLYPNCTADLLGLKDVIVTKVENSNNQIHLWLEPVLKMQVCPTCRHETKRTHSYREQLVSKGPATSGPALHTASAEATLLLSPLRCCFSGEAFISGTVSA